MKGFRAAVGFLTILSVSPPHPAGLAFARGYFPLVGLMLGAFLAGLDLLLTEHLFLPQGVYLSSGRSPLLVSAILVVSLVVLTRGLHLDGFMDTCDGLFGGFSRTRRLEILRDSQVGAFAVVGVVSLLIIKCAALASLFQPLRLPVLILFPCLSRWAMLLLMEIYPYARAEGLGVAFLGRRGRLQLYFGLACALIASLVAAGILGLVLLLAASLLAWVIGAWASRMLGGLTGDVYGAVNEVVETAVLVLAVFIPARFFLWLQPSLIFPG